MNFSQEFNRIMLTQDKLALATCVDQIPNVRVVNFYYNINQKGIVYFSTFSDCSKVGEFSKNNLVSFTTIPSAGNEHVRISGATIKKSNLTIFDLKNEFTKKIPDYEFIIKEAGNQLSLYEIHFEQATVTLDVTQSAIITL